LDNPQPKDASCVPHLKPTPHREKLSYLVASFYPVLSFLHASRHIPSPPKHFMLLSFSLSCWIAAHLVVDTLPKDADSLMGGPDLLREPVFFPPLFRFSPGTPPVDRQFFPVPRVRREASSVPMISFSFSSLLLAAPRINSSLFSACFGYQMNFSHASCYPFSWPH